MNKTFRLFAALLLAAAMLFCTACSGEESSVQEAAPECSIAGHYTLCAYASSEATANEEELKQLGFTETVYLNINSNGTGELAMDEEGVYSITVDEENRVFNVDNGETIAYSMSGSMIVVTTNADNIWTFRKAGDAATDAMAAITELLESSQCSIAGYYTLTSVTNGDEVMDEAALSAAGMTEGTYISINADGTGEIAFSGDSPSPLTVDESSSTITDEIGESVLYSTDGSSLTLTFPDNITMTFTKQDSAATPEAADGDAFYSIGYWYGWLSDENDDLHDIWGIIGTDEATGKPYFELYTDVNGDPDASLFVTVNEEYSLLLPDIGEDDAWAFDTMLTPDDAEACFIHYEEGVLKASFDLMDAEGIDYLAYLRPEGAEWAEDDLLPPGMQG